MKIKILIVGLGGVGGYYGGLLARKYKENAIVEIYFLARGVHLQEIKQNGLKVITETETFIAHPTLATDNVNEIGTIDYIIITTKSYDLATTIQQLKPCISEQTVILPLLNGVDISSRIRTLLPKTEVWNGCVYIVGRLNKPGIVESSGGVHDLFFGNENQVSVKLLFMEKLLKDAEIKAVFSEKIREIIWRKFIFISSTASLTSYFNVGFRDVLTEVNRKATTIAVLHEISEIAKAEGVVYDYDIIDTTIKHIERLPFATTSSMHTDFKAGKNTELNTLTGIVIELGIKHGVPTPMYEIVYNKLSSLDTSIYPII